MALKSMTGFGRAEENWETWSLKVEVKSLNHRFLEIIPRLPKRYQALEEKVRREIRERFARGRFEVLVQISGTPPQVAALNLNQDLAEEYLRALRYLKTLFHLPGEVEVTDLLRMREVFTHVETEEDLEKLWQEMGPVFERALEDLAEMRAREGAFLEEVLKEHLHKVETLVEEIERLKEPVFEAAKARLEERVKKLLQDQEVDPLRLHQEIVFLADKTDFTEELDRLKSHLAQFRKTLQEEGPVGRKLDFLLQEMFREINTLSNKAGSAEISHLAVEIKCTLEKMREQVQNIE
ncbi:MAG: YicC family protein [Thermodesulfobacteria bacterium]|nr:YicC family protein [Thermodesulfobacteriota bacterium]